MPPLLSARTLNRNHAGQGNLWYHRHSWRETGDIVVTAWHVPPLTLWTSRYFSTGFKSLMVWTVKYYGGFSRSWQLGLRLSHLLVIIPLHPYSSAGYLRVQYLAHCCSHYTPPTLWRSRHSMESVSTLTPMIYRRMSAVMELPNNPLQAGCSSVSQILTNGCHLIDLNLIPTNRISVDWHTPATTQGQRLAAVGRRPSSYSCQVHQKSWCLAVRCWVGDGRPCQCSC